jgi:hypothetical protein
MHGEVDNAQKQPEKHIKPAGGERMGKRSFLAQSEYRIKVQKLSPNKTDIDSVVERLVFLKGGPLIAGITPESVCL